eukprot:TRINITY_DN1323_c0_g1_i1.p2 TRINITY_DN1323_c0_g1~~TRINITY_DN1323_c0_g1_i1.p2  ORF type:complete len:155 (+),score=33.23 TRINITY_DN1323_c0_g1_i1:131-595(+)
MTTTLTQKTGGCVKDVAAQQFIVAYAAHLKKSGKIQLPKWADIVKTGTAKELPPNNPDWYYVRAASMARKIYLRHGSGLGVGSFRKLYGSRKRNGTAPSHFRLAAGGVARHILQQLEKIRVIEADPKGGRKLTSNGRRDLDRIAGQVNAPPKAE